MCSHSDRALSRARLQGRLTVWFPPTHLHPHSTLTLFPRPGPGHWVSHSHIPASIAHADVTPRLALAAWESHRHELWRQECDSQAGAGSHSVCGHALGLGASCGREPAAHPGTGRPPTRGCPAGGLGSLEVPELRRVRNSPSQVYLAPSGHPHPEPVAKPPPLLKADVPVPRPPHREEVGRFSGKKQPRKGTP